MTDSAAESAPRHAFFIARDDSAAAVNRIDDRLSREITSEFGPRDEIPFCLEARDDAQNWLGALRGVIHWRWLYVAQFFVPAEARGQGLGAALLREAENLAREKNCVGLYLDSFSPRAEIFYRRHGFEPFGALKNFPPGATRRYLSKRLIPASA